MAVKKAKKSAVRKPDKKEPVRAEPVRELTPFEEMEQMFDQMRRDLFSRNWLPRIGREPESWSEMFRHLGSGFPATDVIDRDNEVVVHAELPGMSKEDIELSVSEDSVTIKGESHKETRAHEGDYVRRELRRGSFSRTVSLPGPVDPDSARATFKDGVLELTLNKMEHARRRTIQVE